MWFLDPAALAGGIASSNPSLGAVVMPEYRPGAPVDVVRLTPGEMAALLASNMFNLRLLGRPALELVARLSAGLVGFRLIHGGVHGAVAAIDRLEIS